MRKLIFTCTLIVSTSVLFAQTNDYRTAEDGLTKLINNPDFINDVVKLGTEDITLEKLDSYFTKYIPEYSNFKIDKSKINFDNLYYANSEGATNDFVATQLGSLLNLNSSQTESLKNIFTGNLNYTPTNNLSVGYGNLLFERGKDVSVDLTVDFAVDFFQKEFGDGGVNSALIDIGGELLGALIVGLDKKIAEKEEAKMAEDAKIRIYTKKLDDYNIYIAGDKFSGSIKVKEDQKDLLLHFKANSKMPNHSGASVNFDEAINLLNEVINLYKQNPERAAYLYLAYIRRAQCKMQKGAYRAAIIDYYYAQEKLKNILNGQLPDNLPKTNYPPGYHDLQNKDTYLKGTVTTTIGRFSQKDMVIIVLNRAYAKYRLEDYKGAIADCKLALGVLDNENVPVSGKPNDYKDVIQAIIAMSQFGLESYKDSYTTFSAANLNDDLLSAKIVVLIEEEIFQTNQYYGIPNYFHLDITQIKGLCYYKANKIKEAIATYESLVYAEYAGLITKAGGDISAVYSTLGSFYYALGDKTQAILHLDKAITINPYQMEYYFKRGTYKKALGQINEANADFKIVREPESLIITKKDLVYYNTKYTKFSSESNHTEAYGILKEALMDYPDDLQFFNYAVKHLFTNKSNSEAKELADLLISQQKKHHLLMSLHYDFSGNMQRAETEMQLAFDNGFGFYEFKTIYYHFDFQAGKFSFNLKEKPYYFKLFTKYATKTNNNFISRDLSEDQKAYFITYSRESDSICDLTINNLPKSSQQFMENYCAIEKAKRDGNIEVYLSLLNKIKEISVPEALDKIECLIILGRGKEAHDFAKKAVISLKKSSYNTFDSFGDGKSLLNFANDSFVW